MDVALTNNRRLYSHKAKHRRILFSSLVFYRAEADTHTCRQLIYRLLKGEEEGEGEGKEKRKKGKGRGKRGIKMPENDVLEHPGHRDKYFGKDSANEVHLGVRCEG